MTAARTLLCGDPQATAVRLVQRGANLPAHTSAEMVEQLDSPAIQHLAGLADSDRTAAEVVEGLLDMPVPDACLLGLAGLVGKLLTLQARRAGDE